MNAIAQIFKNAGVTPTQKVEVREAEEVTTQEEVRENQPIESKLNTKTQVICRKILQVNQQFQKMYRKEYRETIMAVETEDKTNSIKEELQKAYEDFKKKTSGTSHH